MIFVIVVGAPIVHQHPLCATRSNTMLEMTHCLPVEEEEPIAEGWDQDECDDYLLVNFIRKKKMKKK